MNCHEAIPLTHAFCDGELDVARTLEFEAHLADCPSCARACQNIKALKGAFNTNGLYFKAPPSLRRQIRAAVVPNDTQSDGNPFPWWGIFKLAIPVVGVALIALLLAPILTAPSREQRLAEEVTSNHVRSLLAEHKTDVISSDQHTVKPWFQGKVDFTFAVTNLADSGFPLLGGRLDYLHGRRVAALVYQRHLHTINVFIWPASGSSETSEKATTSQGYNLIHWTSGGMTFWAVSDLNHAELADFVHLLK